MLIKKITILVKNLGGFMPRPMKCRIITEMPNHLAFKPVGMPMEELEKVILTLDEYEALRLADFEELYQENAAEKMNVSRQTFGNIVKSARKKVSETLITGKAIIIESGDVTILNKPCPRCKKNRKSCPKCEDKNDEDNLSGE